MNNHHKPEVYDGFSFSAGVISSTRMCVGYSESVGQLSLETIPFSHQFSGFGLEELLMWKLETIWAATLLGDSWFRVCSTEVALPSTQWRQS